MPGIATTWNLPLIFAAASSGSACSLSILGTRSKRGTRRCRESGFDNNTEEEGDAGEEDNDDDGDDGDDGDDAKEELVVVVVDVEDEEFGDTVPTAPPPAERNR